MFPISIPSPSSISLHVINLVFDEEEVINCMFFVSRSVPVPVRQRDVPLL